MTKTHLLPWMLAGCVATTGAMWTTVGQAAGASVEKATPRAKFDANNKYRKGNSAFKAGRYEEALKRFRESFDIVASPNSHLMVARVLIKMERLVDAHRELDLVIAEAEAATDQTKYKKTADAARAEQEKLNDQLAFLVVDMGVSAQVDGTDYPPENWGKPIPIKPGTVEIVLRGQDGTEEKQKVELTAGKKTTLSPPAPKAPDEAPPPPEPEDDDAPTPIGPANPGVSYQTLGYVAGGVGLAGVATFTIFGLVNNSQYSDLESECADHRCPERLADSAESGRTYQTLANVGLGVGVVGLGTAAVLFLMGSSEGSASVTTAATTPRLVVGPRFVSVAGGF